VKVYSSLNAMMIETANFTETWYYGVISRRSKFSSAKFWRSVSRNFTRTQECM